MLNNLKEKMLHIEAVRRLKDFKASVSLEGSEGFLNGTGKAVVTMIDKINQKKAVVEFDIKRMCDRDPDSMGTFKVGDVSIRVEGKEILSHGLSCSDKNTFSESIKRSVPHKPYDAIYMMAVVAVTPEVEKIENKLRQDMEAPEKLNRKILSNFMNRGRS